MNKVNELLESILTACEVAQTTNGRGWWSQYISEIPQAIARNKLLQIKVTKLKENNNLLHEYIEQNRITHLVARIAELEKQPDLETENEQLLKALKLAYEAMNYLGDILNNHDMTQPEDEAVTKEAFEVVSKIVGKSKP